MCIWYVKGKKQKFAILNVFGQEDAKQKGKLPQYEKSYEVYDKLLPYQENALLRAKKRLETLNENHQEIICRGSNPVTTAAELVEYLNSRR